MKKSQYTGILARPIPQDDEAARQKALEALCAHHGVAVPETLTPLEKALLAAHVPAFQKPRKPAQVGKPAQLNTVSALMLSYIYSDLRRNHKMNERDAAAHVCHGLDSSLRRFGDSFADKSLLLQEVCDPETLRRTIRELKKHRDKLIKNEKFRAKLFKDRDRVLVVLKTFAEYEYPDKAASEAIMKLVNETVEKYLGGN